MLTIDSVHTLTFPLAPPDLVFMGGGREVLRIKADGELMIAPDATPREAAEALYEAWQNLMCPTAPAPPA